MVLGLGCHTLALATGLWSQGLLAVATFAGALSIFAWALVAAFLLLYWRYPIKVLGALVAPLAALVVSGSLILHRQATAVSPALRSFWVYIHIILAFIGNASLTLAGLACLYTMSPDGHFLVGTRPGCRRTHFAAGLSGHGFKLAPALGDALADLAIHGRTELPVGFLSPGRFANRGER